jgi:zinc protease
MKAVGQAFSLPCLKTPNAQAKAPAPPRCLSRLRSKLKLCQALLILLAVSSTSAALAQGTGGRGAVTSRAATPPKPASAPAATPSPRDLTFPAPHAVQPLKMTAFTLANGMKLYLAEQHEVPVLGGIAMIRTGGAFDPADRVGLAALAGVLLRSGGTSVKTGEQVDDTLNGLGMTMDASIGDTSGMLSFTALADNTDLSLALVKEVLTRSEFRHDRLEQAKAQLRNAIAHRNDDPASVAQRELRALVFGKDSPYAWKPEYSTIERITRTDLKNFYRRYFFPANVMLGIWGDFDTGQMKAKVEGLFSDWTGTQPAVGEFPQIRAVPAPGLYLAEKKDALQSWVAVGHLGGMASQKDFPALEVMGVAFDQLQARIAQRARADAIGNVRLIGVSYENVNAAWGAGFDHQGLFHISAATRGASTVEAIQGVNAEIERMRTAEISDEELRLAKETLLARQADAWNVRAKAFARMMSLEYYGYPKEFPQQYQAGILAVTKADVLRVAKAYLKPADLTTLVVGNPQVFAQPLEKVNAKVNRIDLTIPEARPKAAETTDATLGEARRLLGRAQEAAGGAEKLAAVKDALTVSDYVIDTGVPNLGGARLVETDRWIAPTTFRQDVRLPTGPVSAYTDGKAGWVATPQGWGALVGTQLKQVQGDLFRWYFRLLVSDRIEGRTINAVDQDMIEVTDASGELARVEFDPKTGLPLRLTYDVPQAAGAPVYSEEVYEDYREVGGIRFPFKVTLLHGGRKFADVAVTDCKVDSGLRLVDLARRQ